jgi:DNA mismatch endonuclease (patch repair protein)
MMAGISGKDTRPELVVRRSLHAAGFRYRLNVPDLPGRPDLVLPRRRAIVFIHGCFWHRHRDCKFATNPATRPEFWAAKFQRNTERDATVHRHLLDQGWRVAVIWECATRQDLSRVIPELKRWLLTDERELELPDALRSEPRPAT